MFLSAAFAHVRLSCALLSACALGCGIGLASPAARAEAPAISPAAIRAHVRFLADDLLEGRKAGTRGHEIAARYVAAQFAQLGLTPAGDAGDWFQQVPLQEQVLDAQTSMLTILGRADRRDALEAAEIQAGPHWRHGTEVVITPSPLAQISSIEAPVVFVGFGLDAPEYGYDDYRGLDVRGKIVAALLGTPQGTPSEMGAHLAATKDAMAQRRGAIGLIHIDTLAARALFPWPQRVQNDAQPRMTWVDAQQRPHVGAPGILASAALDRAPAEALFANAPKPLQAVLEEADRRDGRPRGFALRTRVRIQWRSAQLAHRSPNVLGLLPGSDPALRDEIVLMMAHLDHVGRRAAVDGDAIVNGALDNAAGVALMLEVARACAGAGERPRRSLLFLANTAEEQGLLGTEYFAAQPTVPLRRIVAVLNLDVPILTYEFQDVIAFGAEHSTLAQSVRSATRRVGVALSPDPMPEQGLFTRSDHYALVKRGIPALFLATGRAAGGAAAWQTYLQHHYHRPSDDLSQPLSWRAAARFAQINRLLLQDIANAPQAPRWYADSFFGKLFAPEAAKAARPGESDEPALQSPPGES